MVPVWPRCVLTLLVEGGLRLKTNQEPMSSSGYSQIHDWWGSWLVGYEGGLSYDVRRHRGTKLRLASTMLLDRHV
jgi:hypothetical protein